MKRQTKFGLVLAAAAVISVSVASLVSARGWVQQGADWYYVDNNNDFVTETIQASGNSKFYLGEDGRMVRDYLLEAYGDSENYYYFGSNGAMVTNTWVAVDSSIVENQNDDYVPDNYWYYFQASGKAMKGTQERAKKSTIDGKKYAFDQYGHMCVGWFNEAGEVKSADEENPFADAVYYAGGDNDGVLRAGWLTYYDGYDGGDDLPMTDYANLYFYFNTSNNKKYGYDGEAYKKINGRNYAFTSEGVMLSGWDPYDLQYEGTYTWSSLADKITYFSGEDDGHQVKKGWVYAVPSENVDSSKHEDDEEVYMYFGSSGAIEQDKFKKINGKWYVFGETGVMKTGIVLWCAAGTTPDGIHFIDTLDPDYAEGSDVMKAGLLQTNAVKWIRVAPDGRVEAIEDNDPNGTYDPNGLGTGDYIKLHYFGDDGARRTGTNTVALSDDNYSFYSTGSQGDKGSGNFSKKYYSLGFQLKASSDLRYGIYSIATYHNNTAEGGRTFSGPFINQSSGGRDMTYFRRTIMNNEYIVLTTSGSAQKGAAGAKKDADGNYWLIDRNSRALKGIWTVNANTGKGFSGGWTTKTVLLRQGQSNPGPTHRAGTIWDRKSTCSYADLVANDLAFAGCGDYARDGVSNIEDSEWTAHIVTSSNGADTVYFTLTSGHSYAAYQSDYRGQGNKWIPMGLKDDSNKSVLCNLNAQPDVTNAHAYEVIPSNDYFLNCYWHYTDSINIYDQD